MAIIKKLEWEDKYSVGIKEIDDQHKIMFSTVNQLVDIVSSSPTFEKINPIIVSLISYKKFHFDTEEKYFKEFNYDKTAEHLDLHRQFSQELELIKSKYKDDVIGLAYELVDFLEDWLIDHLMGADQEYKQCFHSHGLK